MPYHQALGPAWPYSQETGIAHLVDCITPISRQSSLTLQHSILVWQLHIIRHRTNMQAAFSYEPQNLSPDKLYDDNDDSVLSISILTVFSGDSGLASFLLFSSSTCSKRKPRGSGTSSFHVKRPSFHQPTMSKH